MPRHPRNTKRGSSVLLRKRQQERKWHVALTEKAAHRAFPLRRIASLHCLPYKALCKRWRRFLAAELTGRCCAGMEASRTCAQGRTQSPPSTTHTRQFCAASFLASEPAMGHPSRSTRLHCNYAAISTSHVTPEPSAVVLHSPPAMDSSQPSSSVSVSPRIALPSFTSATESWQGATSIKNASTSSTQCVLQWRSTARGWC